MQTLIIWILSALSVLALLLFTGCEEEGGDTPKWALVWADEFDGPAGQLPNPENWTYDIGTDWGNNQLEWTTDRPENVSLDGNGNLVITAREESYEGQNYTSARIVTRGLQEFKYGRVEARIDLPVGQGIWPAFWMLGANIDQVGWPQCGEIDIMEFRGQEPNVLHGTLHGPGHYAGDAYTKRYVLPQGRLDNGFHTYAIEWEGHEIRWYLDGVLYHSGGPEDIDGEWVYDHPFYIILNIAVGGNFVGPPNNDTEFPQEMIIDYVRVYEDAR